MKALIYRSRFVLVFLFSLGISVQLRAQSPPGSLSKLVEIDIPLYMLDAIVKDGYLYVSGYSYLNSVKTAYLRVYDISTPTAPVFKTAVTGTEQEYGAMLIDGALIYIAGSMNDSGLIVYNISNPASPTLVANHNCITVGSAQKCPSRNIAKSGNLLFTNKGLDGMVVFNISSPQSPSFQDDFTFTWDIVEDFAVLSSSELLLNDGGGIRSVNFSNPANILVTAPEDARYLDLTGDTESWVLSSDKSTAYVYSWGIGSSVIHVVDVPSRTKLATVDIKAYSSTGGRMILNANGSKLFIGAMEFNITNRSTLTFLGRNGFDNPMYFDVASNLLFARDGAGDIWIMGTGGSTPAVPAPTASQASSIASTSFVASWSAVTGAASYRLDVTKDNFATFITGYNGKTISGTTETVTGLTANTAYSYRVRAVNSAGTSSVNSGTINVTTSASGGTSPTITSFTPTSGPVGTAVTITGTNFTTVVANNTVKFNGVTATLSASTPVSITTSVPAGATTGAISVTVGANTGTSLSNFTVSAAPAPAITAFSPASGSAGTSVTISGSNFSTTPANNTVKFNGVTATVSASTATSITTSVPAGSSTGPISVTVNGNTATSTSNFTIISGPVPTINAFTPTSGSAGTSVTISGSNFSATPANNSVKFNGVTATVTASTTTSLTTSVPAGSTTGPISVTVGSETGTSTTNFTIIGGPAPTVTAFTPVSGATGTSVTINGTNFSTTPANNTVKFNGVTAIVSASTATSLTTTVPAGSITGPITVTVGSETATSSTNFTVLSPPPTITSISPANGPIGSSVTITGTNFSATALNNLVRFNGVQATVTSSTVTSIKVTVPAFATTGRITVIVGAQTVVSASDFILTNCTNPSKPTITASGLDTVSPTLTSSSATGNQWLKNGTPIANATSASLNVTTPGIYSVQVSVAGGCISEPSDNFEIVVTGGIKSTDSEIRFYPNPAVDKLIFETPVSGTKTLRLLSSDGKSMIQTRFESTSLEVDVHQYEAGLYYFVINTEAGATTGKILKK